VASIFRSWVWGLASDLGHATGFDSPVGVSVFYLFAATLQVHGRLANHRPIAMTPLCMPSHTPQHATSRPLLLLILANMPPS
jgi:hypothetical protein